jgi:hypothetical protein
MRGTMLWFNEAKDSGLLLTEEGERLPVPGDSFADGIRPKGRCAQAVVAFEVGENEGAREASEVELVPSQSSRRARRRHTSNAR